QGGLPLALATRRHVSFQAIPFVTFAHGQTTTGPRGATDAFIGYPVPGGSPTAFGANRVEVGARTGFEVFFGFIGIPELSLSATVGLQFEMFKNSSSANGLSQSDTTLRFTTTVQNNPWDIFAGNVAARYYF